MAASTCRLISPSSADVAGRSKPSMTRWRRVMWPTRRAQFTAGGLSPSAWTNAPNRSKRNHPASLPSRSSGGGGTPSSRRGARLTPQFPATRVVTPWLTLGVRSGMERSARSSCVCASTKPGATMRSVASISRARPPSWTLPTATMRSAAMPTSARRRAAPVPSIRRPLRMTSSTALMGGPFPGRRWLPRRPGYLTMRTLQPASWLTFCDTLPRSAASSAPSPRDPTTRRSIWWSFA